MAKYLVESRHTVEDCLQALDAVMDLGPQELARYDWGCAASDHAGYAIVEADSKSSVEQMVPQVLRHKTRIVELSKFTPEQIRSFHQGL